MPRRDDVLKGISTKTTPIRGVDFGSPTRGSSSKNTKRGKRKSYILGWTVKKKSKKFPFNSVWKKSSRHCKWDLGRKRQLKG